MASVYYGSAADNLRKITQNTYDPITGIGYDSSGTQNRGKVDTRQWGNNEIPTKANGVALPGNSLVVPTTSDRDYSLQNNVVAPPAPIPVPPPPAPVPRRDYSAEVRGIYDPLKSADLSAIRAAFDSAISGYTSQKPLQDQYKASSLNTVDSNYYNSLGGLNAAMEAGGQRGGENITGNIALQSVRGQGVNQTNQTYQNNLSAIDEAVRQAEASRATQESQAGLKWDSQIAQAIQAAEQQGINNAQSLAGLTGSYVDPTTGIKTPTLEQKAYDTKTTDAALQQQLDTIGQYAENYQAEINNRESTNPNDPLLPYLRQARTQKIQEIQKTQKAAEEKAVTLQTAADKLAWDNALDMWKASGVANQQIANILGIKEGARTADYNLESMRIAKSGSSTPKVDSFTLDDWAKTLDAEFLPEYNSFGSQISPGITDPKVREQRILDLNLDSGMTAQLYRKYGIPLPQ